MAVAGNETWQTWQYTPISFVSELLPWMMNVSIDGSVLMSWQVLHYRISNPLENRYACVISSGVNSECPVAVVVLLPVPISITCLHLQATEPYYDNI